MGLAAFYKTSDAQDDLTRPLGLAGDALVHVEQLGAVERRLAEGHRGHVVQEVIAVVVVIDEFQHDFGAFRGFIKLLLVLKMIFELSVSFFDIPSRGRRGLVIAAGMECRDA
mgnify:CR=1 FL=1